MKDKFIAKVESIVSRMRDHEQNARIVFEAICLQDRSIKEFVNEFIELGKTEMTEHILDIASDIIVSAKTVYESDKYCDPFTDELYDKMLSKFKKFRPEPFGNNSVGLANAKYKYDVLSGTLDKVHFIYNSQRGPHETRDSLEDYIDKIPVDKDRKLEVLVNQKKDGTSVTIDYKLVDGRYIPQSAISRGKKDYGEGTDVSAVMPDTTFRSDLLKEVLGFRPKYIGVQYEMLVSDNQREKLAKYMGKEFVNNRSAVAGLLRRIVFASKSEAKELRRFMSLVPVGFDVLSKYVEDDSYYELPWSKIYVAVCGSFIYGEIGMDYEILTGTKKELLKRFEKLSKQWIDTRKDLNHSIDGMVMTILDRYLQRKMGRKNNINQYQIAFKFPEEAYKTVVRDIIITTGNFGYKEMLLKVDPVVLNGTTQFKAQVHSLDRFKKLDLHIGDEIILKLSGDVIPYGYKDETCRKGTGPKIKFPKYCECGAPLIEEKNRFRCSNPNCPFRVSGSLITFFTELNSKGIGQKTCEQLRDELGITKPSQVLKLKFEDFRKLKGFKDASAQACVDTINDIRTKPRTVAAIISALGIDTLRTSTAIKLLESVSVNKLISLAQSGSYQALMSEIRKADGIDENASKLAEGLIDKCEELKELLTLIPIKEPTDKSNLTKVIVVSGMRNDEALIKVANNAGFDVKDSGSKYDILVIKDETMLGASKAQFAKAHNRPIMTRAQFMSQFGGK